MPQELTTKMMEALPNPNMVRPYDKVTVWATGTGGYHKPGKELKIHPRLAEKLIAAGKATDKKPEGKKTTK